MSELKPAVFLDRDKTLNPDPGYISEPAQFELFPGVGAALRRLQDAGFTLVVVTSQSGVARGLISREQLEAIHDRMVMLLWRHGVRLAGIYVCPHHPDAGCPCRKPSPALILQAAAELGLALGASWTVGDKEADARMGLAAGTRTIRVGPPDTAMPADLAGRVPLVPDLPAAADLILADRAPEPPQPEPAP